MGKATRKPRQRKPRANAKGDRLLLVLLGSAILWAIVIYALFTWL